MNPSSNDQSIIIALNSDLIHALDLSPVTQWIHPILIENRMINYEQKVAFDIDYPRDKTDPRELSEIPEVRLWFVRLDSLFPYFMFFLAAKKGELARYTAMLVPHQFNRSEGIQYNPEALELFLMQKIFILSDWLRKNEIFGLMRLKSMAQLLGYDIDDKFLQFLVNS